MRLVDKNLLQTKGIYRVAGASASADGGDLGSDQVYSNFIPNSRRMRTLFLRLERLARSERVRKNRFRTNLVPDAPRDKHGFLVDGIPSMAIRSGPVFRICKEMRPDFPFNVVQLNKFSSHRQCQWHVDRKNVGVSLIAMMGKLMRKMG